MLKTSNLNTLVTLLSLLVVAKLISLIVLWYLPSNGVEMKVKQKYKHQYQRVDFRHMFADKKTTAQKINKVQKQGQILEGETISGISITNMILKGLYGKGQKGFVIIALKSSSKKTSIISVGELYKGYKLHAILNKYIVFTKASKKYILKIENGKRSKGAKNSYINKFAKKAPMLEKETRVARSDIKDYAKNPAKIMQDIAIVAVKEHGKIKGFKVTRIKRDSKMKLLGLQVGDLIVKANNVVLSSYKNALDLYKNIDKIDTIQIVIMRNNQEKELVYEIN